MNKFGILTRLYLKQYFSMPKDKKAKKKRIGAMVGIGACFLPIVAILCFSISNLAGMLFERGQAYYLLGAIMFVAQIFILFFGLATFISIMFYSKDNEFLATLPVPTITVYLSKMVVVYLTHIVTSMAILVPSMITIAITAGVKSIGLGAEYYILGLIAIPIVPLIPLLVISIIAMPLAWIGRLFKRSNVVTTILAILVVVGLMCAYLIGVSTLSSSAAGGMTDLNAMLDSLVTTLKTLSMIMYPNLFIAKAMLGVSVAANFFIYLAIVIGAGGLSILLSLMMYKKNSVRFLEVGTKANAKEKKLKSYSTLKTLVIRDLKSCLRETSLAMNCIMGILIAPIMVGVFGILFTQDAAMTFSSSFMIFVMSVAMLAGSNYLAIIAVTREGSKFYMIKYMPIRVEDFVKAKQILANAYIVLGAILVGAVIIFTKVHYIAKIAVVANVIIFGFATTDLSIERDLKNPKLNWINIKQAMKSRMTVLVPMLIGMLEGVVLLLLSLTLPMLIESQIVVELIQWSLITLVNTIMFFITYSRLKQNQYKHFMAIEANNG